jgi:hypothetical protein
MVGTARRRALAHPTRLGSAAESARENRKVTGLHRSVFLKELKETFPQLKDAINSEHGLLHLEMHVFRDFAQGAIRLGNAKEVRRCFMVAEKYYNDGNESMKNAVVVSFVEHLELHDARWAWELLGQSLKDVYSRCVEAGMARPLPYLSARRDNR